MEEEVNKAIEELTKFLKDMPSLSKEEAQKVKEAVETLESIADKDCLHFIACGLYRLGEEVRPIHSCNGREGILFFALADFLGTSPNFAKLFNRVAKVTDFIEEMYEDDAGQPR